ncbi:MAG: hypothetical protein ACRDSK_28160, partial [Actinophytocola sp.]|uniref:hypothetical protein n=1 Tax=Actinophytocola sp. TaxID=1872138 RepID=UPI003D6A7C7E
MRTRTFPGLGFDPTPGSPADVETVLERLARATSAVDASAGDLRRAARPGSWRGAAASAFRADTAEVAGRLDSAVTALRSAARAVSSWQARLVANQREADALESAACRLRVAPEAAAALARVLDRAGRLAARH